MKINTTQIEKNIISFEIEVPPEEVRKEREKIYQQLQAIAKVPGFRSGKIPRDVLEKHFKDSVKEKVIKNLVPRYLLEAVKDRNITPLTLPRFNDISLGEDDSLKFKAVVETHPAIELKDYKNIRLRKIAVEVTEEEIDQRLKELQLQASIFTNVEDRDEAKDGDFAIIDFKGFLNNRPLKGWARKNFLIEVGEETFVPGLSEAIAGMKKGNSKNVEIQFPSDYPVSALRDKKVIFEITLNELKERKVPPVDQELAKNFGFENLDLLKESIREEIKLAKEEGEKQRLVNEMVERLISDTNIDLPSSLIERQKDYLMYKLENELVRTGISKEDYLRSNNITEEDLEKKYREAAIKQLKAKLIFSEISKKENIKVEEEDIKNVIDRIARSLGQEPEKVRRQLEQRNLLDNLIEDILERKIVNFLFKEAKIEEKGGSFWAGIGRLFRPKNK